VISDNFWLVGEDKTLNPKKYFIIIPALFGNGQSTSPSTYSSASDLYPKCCFYDNVRAQHELVTKHLGITHLRAVVGWSMGAAQTYQWATQYPDIMDLAVPFCGSAKTSLHNQVFLEGVKAALLAAKQIPSAILRETRSPEAGQVLRTWDAKEKEIGLKALGRVYAGW
jgi:homoserine O-acetyltransferase